MKYLYRYVSEYPTGDIRLLSFPIIKETECTYLISVTRMSSYRLTLPFEKRVMKKARSSFAYSSKEKALENYIARTKRYLWILRWQVLNVEDLLDLADRESKTLLQKGD